MADDSLSLYSLCSRHKPSTFFIAFRSGSSWLWVTPFGIRKMMNWFKYNYNNIPVYITENGISDRNGTLYDYHRIHFYRLYISEVLKGRRCYRHQVLCIRVSGMCSGIKL